MESDVRVLADAFDHCVDLSGWVCDQSSRPGDHAPYVLVVSSNESLWLKASQFAGRFLRPGDEGYAVPDRSITDTAFGSDIVQRVRDKWPAYVGEPSPDAKTLVNRTARVLFDAGTTVDDYVGDMCASYTQNFECRDKTYDVYHIATELEDLISMWESWH